MTDRSSAIQSALHHFDSRGFRARLAELVAVRSTSQDPGHEPELRRYLTDAITPWLERLGFTVRVHDNPVPGFGPILTAERMEDPDRPTVLTYGHGDTVRGLADQWDDGRDPWMLSEQDGRWYGRGSADNKGQHAIVLTGLEHALAARGGRLGANVRLVLETGEERGSVGLREFVATHADALRADVLIASDGPRVNAGTPTITCGTRGSYNLTLSLAPRAGGVHSGNWGGIVTDPAIVLAHAIACIADRHGRILVPEFLPPHGIAPAIRAALRGCVMESEESATIDPDWGEPGLTDAEKVYAWTSFIVLAMESGRPDNPVNAVAPSARAVCQLRYTIDVDAERFVPALRRHLDSAGFAEVRIEASGMRMAPSRTPIDNEWVRFAAASMARTLGRPPQLVPNGGGGLPGDVFVDHLGVPLVWIPLSYNGCKQHGPNEHLLIAAAREGLAAYAGLWWDLGDYKRR